MTNELSGIETRLERGPIVVFEVAIHHRNQVAPLLPNSWIKVEMNVFDLNIGQAKGEMWLLGSVQVPQRVRLQTSWKKACVAGHFTHLQNVDVHKFLYSTVVSSKMEPTT